MHTNHQITEESYFHADSDSIGLGGAWDAAFLNKLLGNAHADQQGAKVI